MGAFRDNLQRFLFEQEPVRGVLVHLDTTWRAVLERRDYPEPVRDLLGQMMAACALLAATIKFDGRLIMQLQGNGPIRLLVVECDSDLIMRAMAHWQDLPAHGDLERLAGDGRLVVSISQTGKQHPYQGIVPLTGASVAEALQRYMAQSEQIDTHFWLAADGERAAGMLLQKLPGEAGDADIWDRAQHLAGTLRDHELLDLPARQVINRLFHQEDVRVFDPQRIAFRCGCSRERVANALRLLGLGEIRAIVAGHGAVSVDCEFCNRHYHFDAVDAEQLFAAAAPDTVVPPHPTRH